MEGLWRGAIRASAMVSALSCSLTDVPVEPTTAPRSTSEASQDPCLDRALAAAWVIPTRPLDPGASRTAAYQGAEAFRKAQWNDAERHFREALRLDGRSGLTHLALADVLARTGADEEARRRHLATAVVRLPRNPRAHEAFAYGLETDGDPRGALVHLRCAIALAPTRREPRRRAARLALDLEGEAAATEIVRPLLELPETADWLVMADLMAAQENWEGAGEALAAAARSSRSAPLHRRAALAFERAGAEERADAERSEADTLDPPERRKLRPLRNSRR